MSCGEEGRTGWGSGWFAFSQKLMQTDCGMLDDVLEFFSKGWNTPV
jgi:hypothetical protein